MATVREELLTADVELRRAVEKKTAADLDVTELKEKIAAGEEALAGVRGDQKQLDAAVAETRSKIDAVKPKVEAETRREEAAEVEIGEVNRRLQVLHQRQGRGSQFKSTAERDAWLEDQVKDCESTLGRKRDEIAILERDARELRKTIEKESGTRPPSGECSCRRRQRSGSLRRSMMRKLRRGTRRRTNARNCSGATPNSTPSSARRRRK